MQGTRKAARILFAGLLAIGVLAFEAPPAEAAGFLKFDGIDGEATDKNHDKWIDVISIDWGAAKPSTSATGERLMRPEYGAGGPPGSGPGTLTITKRVDRASPALSRRKQKKRRMEKVIVDAKGGGARATYIKYELTNVMITSYTTSGSGANMTETITLNYQKIRAIPARARLQLKPKRK